MGVRECAVALAAAISLSLAPAVAGPLFDAAAHGDSPPWRTAKGWRGVDEPGGTKRLRSLRRRSRGRSRPPNF